MGKGYKNGRTELYMKESGNLIKLMEKENFNTLMVMCMKEIGLMIEQPDTGFALIKTEVNTRDSGKKINSMEKV